MYLNLKIAHAYGYTSIINFKKFIAEIPVKVIDDQYNVEYAFRKWPFNFFDASSVLTDPSFYKKSFALAEVNTSYNKILLPHLLDQARIIYMDYDSPLYLAERITMDHALEMGTPERLVRLSRRMWLVADPKDYVINFSSDYNRIALICLRPNRTLVYRIGKNGVVV